jgi:PST family polysaccharide transporter
LYVEGGLIFGGYLAWVIISQGDYVILKSVGRSDEVVASYWQAFTLSTQTIAIFSMSLLNVLLPVLSHMGEEPQRQVGAFLRAVRVLAVLTMPLCVMQAVLAEPAIRFVFGHKWMSSVPLLQILSLGMAVRVAAIPAHSMLKAQGRFRTYFFWLLGYATLFVATVTAMTSWRGAPGTALGVAMTIAVAESFAIYLCIRPVGCGWREVAGVFAPPMAASLLAGAAALPFNYLPGGWPLRDLVVLLAATAVAGPLYLLAARLLSPAEMGEIRHLARRLRGRLRPRRSGAAAVADPIP